MWNFHKWFERHTLILLVGILVVVSIGGLVQITPLFFIESTIERVQGVRPYTPLELAGRQVYIREGCYTCHSQMIRPLRDEVERYGHYSLAAESMYDHPFQWGSKRTGPDLARVGGRYSDEWHRAHLADPRSVVPESVMPPYAFLANAEVNTSLMPDHLRANRLLSVPYTDEQLANAAIDAQAQAEPMGEHAYDFQERYPTASVRDFDGDPSRVTEMDALIAYLQMLGTGVDFETYQADAPENQR
ncbi:cytochrome-c oxidase, cbb3-type subunit II [Vitreimonas flagellata]|uniref:cytochrome-c oxidase, cbb3-type subunit II n=1 Tax=Vitreimonas flagellata TaxID=2560861 RepID=UPI0010755E51|nr:cytochrome-c oxidase, cbb3-type subunit II [Vitreimonas flagellata]